MTSSAMGQKSLIREDQLVELTHLLSPATSLRLNEPLAKRTTLRVGGPADLLAEPASESDLSQLLRYAVQANWPVFMLGRGSNLLIRDGGVRGLVITLSNPSFCTIQVEGVRLICGAGARLKHVAVEARRNSITGVEFLEGIPGNIGGALRMNAGAMGSAIFEVAEKIRYMNFAGESYEVAASEIPYEYRNCSFFAEQIALGAVLTGRIERKELIEARMKLGNEKRWSSQPAAPSAGCIFKNSVAMPTGKLVEELGLKGMRVGGAEISEVHGNFIVNDGSASAKDVLALIALVKEQAQQLRGIQLQTEVQIIGEDLD
ncbi:MAG: UDP-N-acetylmuramate dehydrogenase [Verrucomicrobiota bacterium]|nr:UDP-N-acetylmuramate dehydrogenase [Verrucomicrobiota bacterium]